MLHTNQSKIQLQIDNKTPISKLLIINDFYTGGGAEIVMHDHIKIFKQKGWKVKLIYSYKDATFYAKSKLRITLVRLYNLILGNLIKFFRILYYNPNVIHLYNWYHATTPTIIIFLWIYKKLRPSTKIFYSAHDFYLILSSLPENKSSKERSLTFKLTQTIPGFIVYRKLKMLNILDGIFAPSKTVTHELKTYTTIAKYKIPVDVLYNPLAPRILKGLIKHRKQWKINTCYNNTKEVVYKISFIGRVTQEKGVYLFIKQLYTFIKRTKTLQPNNFFIGIIGDGPDKNKVCNFLEKNNIPHKCHGRIPHTAVPQTLSKYHALFLNSIPKLENAPLVMREAAILNLFSIVVNEGGMKEFAKLFNGITFIRNDQTSFNKAMQKLLEKIDTACKNGVGPIPDKKLKDIINLFSYDSFYNKLMAYYNGSKIK